MSTQLTLAVQLADFKAAFKQRAAPERQAMREAATADLKATGIEAKALKVGDAVPDLKLPDAMGRPVQATDLIGRDGRIAFAHIEVDYRERAEPSAVLVQIERGVADSRPCSAWPGANFTWASKAAGAALTPAHVHSQVRPNAGSPTVTTTRADQ